MTRILIPLAFVVLLTQCTTQVLHPVYEEQRLGGKLYGSYIPVNIVTADHKCLVVATGTTNDRVAIHECKHGLLPRWAITEHKSKFMLRYLTHINKKEWQCLLHINDNNTIRLGDCSNTRESLWEKKAVEGNRYQLRTPEGLCLSQHTQYTEKLSDCDTVGQESTFQIYPNRINVTGGEIVGVQLGKTARFMGIYYAKAPINERRFMPPVPLDKQTWEGPMLTFRPSYMCPQVNIFGQVFGNENCLNLNVWAPQATVLTDARKPVMVWIHGGGFDSGGSFYELPGKSMNYDGRKLSEVGDVIVVTFNYRLGSLGLLGTRGKFKGNNSIKDQVAALEWVQNNIAQFGGDPDNVTIFGESAGAWSVCTLLAVPKAAPLFHKAIMESGGCPSRTRADQNAADDWLLKTLKCWENGVPEAQEKCLLQLSTATLARNWPLNRPKSKELARVFTISPYVDGETLPIPSLEAVAKGKVNKPLMNGIDKHELAKVTWLLTLTGVIDFAKPEILEALVEKSEAKAYVAPTLEYYKKHDLDEGDLIDDVLFDCVNWQLANGMAGRTQPNYSWLFDIPSFFDINFHTEGLPYVWQQSKNPISHDIGLRWTNFARTGNPNVSSLVSWPKQEPGALKQLKIDKDPSIIKWEEKETCKLLQRFIPWTVIGRNGGWIPTPEQAAN